jgi:ribosomal protein L1
MKKHGKKYTDIAKKAPQGAVSVEEAVAFVKANPCAKFNESVEVGMRMGCDPRKSDQMIRGTTSLPHGTGKDVRVVVFAGGAAADAAKAAGAVAVGVDDLLEKIKDKSKTEQNEIVNYLDEKCKLIEASITEKLLQIEKLKEYKASLIYEYVTGKKQVI